MKRKDITALHQATVTALRGQLVELRKKLAVALLEKRAGKNAHPKMCSMLRDDIARVTTVLREKELVEGTV